MRPLVIYMALGVRRRAPHHGGPRRSRTLLLAAVGACALALAVTLTTPAVAGSAPHRPNADCSIKPKRTYSLRTVLRRKAVTVVTRCDNATRAGVDFEVTAPLRAALDTPNVGVPDAVGDVRFRQRGVKKVRVKLHPKTIRSIRRFRRVEVTFGVVVEYADEPGLYVGYPNDRRDATFRR